MSWKTPEKGWSAPGVGSAHAARLPGVDQRLAQPETRVEYIGGIEVFAAPANPPHAIDHARLAYVLGSVVKPSYQFAVDMLTRTAETSDFAPDASVFSMNTKTGKRKLEELAFEVSDEQPIGVPTDKARRLTQRGVRRVFCILVKLRRVLEWDRAADTWKNLPHASVIEDPCFVAPLEVGALLDAAHAGENVARALIARGAKPIADEMERKLVEGLAEGRTEGLAEGRTEGHAEGRTEGHAEGRTEGHAEGRTEGHAEGRTEGRTEADRRSIRELCDVLEVAWTAKRAAEVLRLDGDALRVLRADLVRQRRWPSR